MNISVFRFRFCCYKRLLLVLSLAVGMAAHAGPPPSHSTPLLATARLLMLEGGELLLWTAEGAAQLRTPQGAWLPAFRMPMSYVLQVIPRDRGFLVLGVPEPGQAADAFPVMA